MSSPRTSRGSGQRLRGIWRTHSTGVSIVALILVAFVAIGPRTSGSIMWNPDALFYQAQMYEVRGESTTVAREKAWSESEALPVTRSFPQTRAHDWQAYAAPFYRRRWLVPALAAAIYPLAGPQRSLFDVSVLGYAALGPLLFLLLRRRFSPAASLCAAAVCVLLPPVITFSALPMTDSWGIALEVAALLAALLALERGRGWIALWALAMLALALTRDATVALLAGVALVAVVRRDRRSVEVLAAGAIACLPVLLILGAPLVKQLAWTIDDFHIPPQATWSWELAHYPHRMLRVLRHDIVYPGDLHYHRFWYAAALALLVIVVHAIVRFPRDDGYFLLLIGLIPGTAVLSALAAGYTGMRVELTAIPFLAAATAFAIERLAARRHAVRRPVQAI